MKTLILAASLVLGIAALPAAASAQDLPPCGPDRTDKCVQAYAGAGSYATHGERRARRGYRNAHHNWRHHGNRSWGHRNRRHR